MRLRWAAVLAAVLLLIHTLVRLAQGEVAFDLTTRAQWLVAFFVVTLAPEINRSLGRYPQAWTACLMACAAAFMAHTVAEQRLSLESVLACTLMTIGLGIPLPGLTWMIGWICMSFVATLSGALMAEANEVSLGFALGTLVVSASIVVVLSYAQLRQTRHHMQDLEDRMGIYRSLLETTQRNARVGGWHLDLEHGRLQVTDSLREMLEIPPHETVTLESVQDYFDDGQGSRLNDTVAHVLRTGASSDEQYAMRTATGRQLIIRNRANAVWRKGRAVEVIGTVIDETERMRVEQTLLAARNEAQRNVESRSRFLANMSHEMRTPLNGIIGMTSLLDTLALSSEQRSCVDTIRTSGEVLLAVINEVLDFSRVESGRIEPERIEFSLEECACSALAIVQQRAEQKGLTLTLEWAPDLQLDGYVGDPNRVRQILVNLLSNAVKFTASGRVTLHVARNDRHLNEVQLAVIDTGIGIAEALQQRLFDPFTQADASTTRRFGGTGLGLSISRGLAELMGGSLTLHSEEGAGSTFTLTLPFELGLPTMVVPQRRGLLICAGFDRTERRAIVLATRPLGLLVVSIDTLAELDSAIQTSRASRTLPQSLAHLFIDHGLADTLTPAQVNELRSRLFGDPSQRRVLVARLPGRAPPEPDGFDASVWKPIGPRQLRAVMEQDVALPVEPADAQAEAALPADLTVLVAEDNPVNRKVAQAMLKRLGIRCETAQHGREAIAMLEQQHYPIVLMDLQMPEMDGLEAARHVRAHHAHQPIIIAMTANIATEDREACVAAGMDGFLAKPATVEQMKQALLDALPALADAASGRPKRRRAAV